MYIRDEYHSSRILDAALEEASRPGTWSEHPRLRLRPEPPVRRGAGAYICGEETHCSTAWRASTPPAPKPPFPVNQGLSRAHAGQQRRDADDGAVIVGGRRGVREPGLPGSTGTKVICLSGDIVQPGNYEVLLGTSSASSSSTWPAGRRGRTIKPWLAGPSPVLPRTLDPTSTSTGWRRPLVPGLRRDHGLRRLARPGRRRLPGDGVLRARVLRQVLPLPHGTRWTVKMLERMKKAGPGDPDGPRHHGVGPDAHHRQLPVRARRRDGDADRLDGREVARRVRGLHRGGAPAQPVRRRGAGRRARPRPGRGGP